MHRFAFGGSAQRTSIPDTTDGGGGNTVEIHAYVKETFGVDQDFELAVYDDDAGNTLPEDQILAEVTLTNTANNDGEIKGAYVAALAGSTKYWVAWGNNPSAFSTNQVYYDTVVGISRFVVQAISLPDNWGDVSNTGDFKLSIWADYAAAGGDVTVTPSALALTATLNAPTIIGDVTVTPSALAITATLNAPVIVGDVTVSPSALAITATVNAPTVTGTAVVSPSALALTATVNAPTVTGTALVSPSALAMTAAVNAPVIDITGSVTVLATALALTLSLKDPTILTGAIALGIRGDPHNDMYDGAML